MTGLPKLAEVDTVKQTLVIDGVDFPYPILNEGGVRVAAVGGEVPTVTVVIPVESIHAHC